MTTSNRLTVPEFEILAHLQSRQGLSNDSRRSDKFGLAANVMSSIALGLRSKGYVASSNDGGTYNYWAITAAGHEALRREREARRVDNKEAQAILATLTAPKVAQALPALVYRVVDNEGAVSAVMTYEAACKAAHGWVHEGGSRDGSGYEVFVVQVIKTLALKPAEVIEV